MLILRTLVCAAATVALLGLGAGPASAAAPAHQVQSLWVAQPSTVCGYSNHARAQMQARGVTPLDVRMTVALGADSAFVNNHGNWQYEGPGLIVTMNDAGCVVTVMRP